MIETVVVKNLRLGLLAGTLLPFESLHTCEGCVFGETTLEKLQSGSVQDRPSGNAAGTVRLRSRRPITLWYK